MATDAQVCKGSLELSTKSQRGPVKRHYLDRILANRWIRRAGTVPRPSRSLDLTPCEYFLWGYLKHFVFREFTKTKNETKECRQINQTVDENTWDSVYGSLKIVYASYCEKEVAISKLFSTAKSTSNVIEMPH